MAFKAFVLTMLAATLHGSFAAPSKDFPKFNLKTVLVDGDTSKNNLYLTAYHTGAGTADAVLQPQKPQHADTYLNGTQIEFSYSSMFQTWLYISYAPYASWSPVEVDSTSGPNAGAFYFNDSASHVDGLGIGLKWNPNYPAPPPHHGLFGGWYACDWYHNVPQLFWIMRSDAVKPHRISTCSKVELVREPVREPVLEPIV